MDEPRWIVEISVRAIHLRELAQHGGLEGVRDHGMLLSALARPRNLFAYADPKPDLAALAASYAYGIIKNHPFVDGNKRTAFVVCRTFLRLNGRNIQASDNEKYQTFIGAAQGTLTEEHLADWVRSKLV